MFFGLKALFGKTSYIYLRKKFKKNVPKTPSEGPLYSMGSARFQDKRRKYETGYDFHVPKSLELPPLYDRGILTQQFQGIFGIYVLGDYEVPPVLGLNVVYLS
ncbi:MAG: hypothetical protein A3J24_01515 [Deltaproteobacteria bacterium RIFCSPLOWO2_02_FULL_53_8]|nr:MAG: hypothetical protein A3J24_01515 [Deltaproteobacteria bacterium RIFCSPLOWO2_02_FULL_53_8]